MNVFKQDVGRLLIYNGDLESNPFCPYLFCNYFNDFKRSELCTTFRHIFYVRLVHTTIIAFFKQQVTF
jgi:hypothetical protein